MWENVSYVGGKGIRKSGGRGIEVSIYHFIFHSRPQNKKAISLKVYNCTVFFINEDVFLKLFGWRRYLFC